MGFVMLIGMFLSMEWFIGFIIAAILVGGVLPIAYSYKFYKKQLADGTLTKEQAEKNVESFFGESIGSTKKAKTILAVSIAVVVVILMLIMFTGEVKLEANDNAILVDAPFYGNVEISYEDIDSAEYREGGVGGMKVNGFNSATMLLGTFQNDEFGFYTRYTAGVKSPCIVLNIDGKITVIGTSDANATLALYNEIIAKTAK